MSNQGDKRGHEDDWWGELYDPRRADVGPAAVADSVDDRFDSASRTLGGPSGTGGRTPVPGTPWGPWAGEPGRAVPGSDGTAGGAGTQGRRSPSGGAGPDAAPPSPPRATSPAPGPYAGEPYPASPAVAPGGAPGPGLGPDRGRPWRAAVAGFVGDGPPTYEAEPTTLPVAGPEELGDLTPDTVLDGARHGTFTLRAASMRGDSARYRGEPRRDALLTARFGTGDGALVLVAVAGGARSATGAPRAARELCEWIAGAVGRNRLRLAEDIHTANRGALKSGLHRLTDRGYGRLRARATELGLAPAEYTAAVRCLLLPAHPACRTRVFFGVGDGGVFRLREGAWQDLEPTGPEGATVGGPVPARERPAAPDPAPGPGQTSTASAPAPIPSAVPFRFRASVARPGDTLLLCSSGLAEPLRGEAALADHLAARWAAAEPPGLAAFLSDAQVRVKGYADDRTAAGVWEA